MTLSGLQQHFVKLGLASSSLGEGVVTRNILAITSLSLALSMSAASARTYTVLGFGTQSCGGWVQARQNASGTDVVFESWLLGFVSSFNDYSWSESPNVAQGTDANGIFAFVDSYCMAHPLDDVATAAGKLIDELQSRTKQ